MTELGRTPITTVAEFRAAQPAFRDASAYPDDVVEAAVLDAQDAFNRPRWGARLRTGMGLYIAHVVVLATQDIAAAAAGRPIGAVTGLVTSKSSAGGSISRDLGSVTNQGAGYFNLTSFGVRYWQLNRWAGGGGVYLA